MEKSQQDDRKKGSSRDKKILGSKKSENENKASVLQKQVIRKIYKPVYIEKKPQEPAPKPVIIRTIRKLKVKKLSRIVIIKNLETVISTKDIMDIATLGKSDVKILWVKTETVERANGQFRLTATVQFDDEEDGENLIKEYNGAELEGNQLYIGFLPK